ncbi:MAG: hypothetical protein ACREMF_02150 [Gemmatimonadales bacterium]
MRYFHRTSSTPEQVLAAAKGYFGARLSPSEEASRRLGYRGSIGKVTISARAEGGHYTSIDVETDQMGESEIDRLAKRFLAEVHRMAEPTHELRGAY